MKNFFLYNWYLWYKIEALEIIKKKQKSLET